MNPSTISKDMSRLSAPLIAVAATTATFAKSFVPFYLIGSTPIFGVACLSGIVLISLRWREMLNGAGYITDVLILLATLYAILVANFLIKSVGQVPSTYLIGLLAFHGLFGLFGFAAAHDLKAVFAILLAQAAVFLICIIGYTLRFGDPMGQGHLGDVFGVGASLYITFHQNIGTALGIAILAALGMARGRAQIVAYAAIPAVLWFMFHIASRTAIVALVCSLALLVGASLWVRSKRAALLTMAVFGTLALSMSGVFYRYALDDTAVNPKAPDAISRTIREIQSSEPGYRLPIWERTWHRIMAEPNRLLFGHGIGAYSIDEGFGPPTWLLDKSTKHYPHNIHLEVLYEVGIVGLLIFTLITFFPLIAGLRLWTDFSTQAKAAISMYVFYLVTCDISGSFAYSYEFQFFFGIAVGVVALRRRELAESGGLLMRSSASRLPDIETSPA
jgi:hypothetical protein